MNKPKINDSLMLAPNNYVPVKHEKKGIFLHHTVSLNARGSIEWWRKTPERVGTAFVIDKDGTIFRAFPEECWANHLGIKGDKEKYWDIHGIGIELVSAGPIHPVMGEMRFYPLWPNQSMYKVIDSEKVAKLPKPYRGYSHFEKYTLYQLAALQDLLAWLISEYNIKVQKSLNNFWEFNPEVQINRLPGIWSHSTVRQDKSDIWPDPNLLVLLSQFESKAPPKEEKPKSGPTKKAE